MSLRTEFAEKGFAVIDYPWWLAESVADTMLAWQSFCSLPIEVKSCFDYSDERGVGYEHKAEVGPTKDLKENFEITLDGLHQVEYIAGKNGIDLAAFLGNSKALLRGVSEVLFQFALKVGREIGVGNPLRNDLRDMRHQWILRYLHYPPGKEPGVVIAAPHVDKAAFTMYLGETTSGVQYYSQERQWVDMPVLSGQTIITPDMQAQYRTGELKALCHRVVANRESQANGRFSIVCFALIANTPRYDKERHGRLQDMPLGFNYDMEQEEFTKLFK